MYVRKHECAIVKFPHGDSYPVVMQENLLVLARNMLNY